MMLTSDHSGRPGGVTFRQFSPLSRETCTKPSSEPAHSTPFSTFDSSKAKMVHGGRPSAGAPSDAPPRFTSLRVKSGLISSQLAPSVVERKTWFPAT